MLWKTLKFASVVLVMTAAPALAADGVPVGTGGIDRIVAAAGPAPGVRAGDPVMELADYRPGHRHWRAPWHWQPHGRDHRRGPPSWAHGPRHPWVHPGPGRGFRDGPHHGFRDRPGVHGRPGHGGGDHRDDRPRGRRGD
ncbi:MAG: hypothetical protein H6842_06250 [Rhodospirillaceae bacterium]|nr:hypothetical protein [Rhodospirillaceae bacterium]